MFRRVTPTTRALLVSGAYAAVGMGYIALSSSYLGRIQLASVDQATIEVAKGIGFIAVTAALLFAVLNHQFRKVAEAREALTARAGELARAQQRASVAAVAAAIGHDMKNVMQVLRAGKSELEEKLRSDPELAETLDDIAEASSRLEGMARELMDRASRDSEDGQTERVNLVEVANECARMSRIFSRGHSCKIEVQAPEACWIEANRKEMEHVLLNLMMNAIDSTDGKGRVDVSITHEDGKILLRVADDGPGVPDDLRERIFEPFFTTKGSKGTGIGLAVTRDVVRQYQGDVRVGDSDPGGALFEVDLLARSGPPPAPNENEAAPG